MISQCHEDQEYPIVFGSITFNPVESRYSQPKLELYGVLWAFKAERHRLYHIHFKLQVDTSSLIQMINAPDLPNAAMTRWITYIKMFSLRLNITKLRSTKYQMDSLGDRSPTTIQTIAMETLTLTKDLSWCKSLPVILSGNFTKKSWQGNMLSKNLISKKRHI